MGTKTFNISFPRELADKIDQKAKAQFGSRSDFLRAAALRYIREEEEFQELMDYGKKLGQATPNSTEETVAAQITAQRRQEEVWRNRFTKRTA